LKIWNQKIRSLRFLFFFAYFVIFIVPFSNLFKYRLQNKISLKYNWSNIRSFIYYVCRSQFLELNIVQFSSVKFSIDQSEFRAKAKFLKLQKIESWNRKSWNRNFFICNRNFTQNRKNYHCWKIKGNKAVFIQAFQTNSSPMKLKCNIKIKENPCHY